MTPGRAGRAHRRAARVGTQPDAGRGRRGGTLSCGARTGRSGGAVRRLSRPPRQCLDGLPAGTGERARRPRRPAPGLPPRAGRRPPPPHELTAPPAAAIRGPPPHLRRPAAGRRDRATRLHVAVVAGDVRAGALQAERHLPGGRDPGPGGEPELGGYLICSRYDTVWHVMNVAVDPTQRRRGIATAMLNALLERVGRDAQLTLEVRRSNAARSRSMSPSGSAPRAFAGATTKTTARTRSSCGAPPRPCAGPSTTSPAHDPGARDLLRRHLRRGRHPRR